MAIPLVPNLCSSPITALKSGLSRTLGPPHPLRVAQPFTDVARQSKGSRCLVDWELPETLAPKPLLAVIVLVLVGVVAVVWWLCFYFWLIS